jgi:hypothetical protein
MKSKLIYKYREFNENTDKIIINSELYFASHTSFNDPFDCNMEFRKINSYTEKEFQEYCKKKNITSTSKEDVLCKLKRKLIDAKAQVGILCMSKKKNNILMWSHYTNQHKGLCFGFEYGFYDKPPITYTYMKYPKNNEYSLISYLKPPVEEIKRIFITKSKHWKYEKEVRLLDLKGGNTTGTKRFKKEYLKEIIFGAKADETDIKKIIQLCEMNGFSHVKFKKARLVNEKFELDFDEIDKNNYLYST